MQNCKPQINPSAVGLLKENIDFFANKVDTNAIMSFMKKDLMLSQDISNLTSTSVPMRRLFAKINESDNTKHHFYQNRFDEAKAYLGLADATKVNKILLLGDREARVFSAKELQEKGLSPDEIKAYNAFRTSADNVFIKWFQVLAEKMKAREITKSQGEGLDKAIDIWIKYRDEPRLSKELLYRIAKEEFGIEVAPGTKLKDIPIDKDIISGLTSIYRDYRPGYYPHVRQGNHYVRVIDKATGDTLYREHFDGYTGTALRKKIDEVKAKYQGKDVEFESGAVTESEARGEMFAQKAGFMSLLDKAFEGAAKDINPDFISELGKLKESIVSNITSEFQAQTFARHRMKREANYVEGFKIDDMQGTFDRYIANASTSFSKMELALDATKMLEQISDPVEKQIAQAKLNEVMRAATKFDKITDRVVAAQYGMAFWGNFKSAIVNGFGYFAQAPAVLADIGRLSIKDAASMAAGDFKKASSLMLEYARSGKKDLSEFLADYNGKALDRTKDAELIGAMKSAVADGITFEQIARDFGEVGSAKDKASKMFKLGMIPMSGTEKVVRLASFISGYKVAKLRPELVQNAAEKGFILEANPSKFAQYISNEVNTIYSKGNRMGIQSGDRLGALMRAGFTMQTYASHALALNMRYAVQTLKLLGDKTKLIDLTPEQRADAQAGASAFLLHTLGQVAVGGLASAPILNAANQIDKWISEDGVGFLDVWKAKAKSPIEMISSFGTPGLAKLDVTGSYQAQVPFLSGSYLYSKFKNPKESIAEAMMPEVFKNLGKAITDSDIKSKDGRQYSINGKTIERDMVDKTLKSLGFNTTDIAQAQQTKFIRKQLDKYVKEEKSKLNAMEDLDLGEVDDFINELAIINKVYGTSYKYSHTPARPTKYNINWGED